MFTIAKELTLILGIYAYFTGWVYAYYFFRSFDITLSSLELPVYYYIVYSFSVFYSILGLIVFLIFGALLWLSRRRRGWLYIILVLAFPIIFQIGRHQAFKAADKIRFKGDNDRVALWLSAEAMNQVDPNFKKYSDENRLRLLMETKDQIIVLYQPPATNGEFPFGVVYHVDKSKVLLLRERISP